MIFNFPEVKFAKTNTVEDQLKHFASECKEIIERIENEDFVGTFEEVADMIHSAETLFRIAQRKYQVDPAQVVAKVIKKNLERGYYINNASGT